MNKLIDSACLSGVLHLQKPECRDIKDVDTRWILISLTLGITVMQ